MGRMGSRQERSENCDSIAIPDSVTTIGGCAFERCSVLASITIPDSVTTIDGHAFYFCISLTSITISDSVATIGGYAFAGCSSLVSITIPDSVTATGEGTFSGCSSLTSITISHSVTAIGVCVFFEGCSSLASISIPDSVTAIGERAFYLCSSLASISIPDSVAIIGDYAFKECNLLTAAIIRPTAAAANEDDGNASTDVWRTIFELPPPPQYDYWTSTGAATDGQQAPIPFEFVTKISAPDAIVNQLTGPFSDCACLADTPRAMRVAPDAATWAGVELWLDWSPPTAAGYTDKTRTVSKSRQRMLLATMRSAARAARPPPIRSTRRATAICVAPEHRLPALPEELWVVIFGFLKHGTPPAF